MFYARTYLILLVPWFVVSAAPDGAADCGNTEIVLDTDEIPFSFPTLEEWTAKRSCIYNVTGWEGIQVKLIIYAMNLSDADGCQKNYIRVADNKSVLATTGLVACGTGSADIASTGNTMTIKVEVEDYLSFMLGAIGWTIGESTTNPPACGESRQVLEQRSEMFMIPLKGQTFERPTVCHYQITTFDVEPLGFILESIELEGGPLCREGFFDVWIGPFKYTLCNANVPKRTFVNNEGELRFVLKTIISPNTTKIIGKLFKGALELENATTAITPYSLNAANRIFVHITLLLCIPLHWW